MSNEKILALHALESRVGSLNHGIDEALYDLDVALKALDKGRVEVVRQRLEEVIKVLKHART